MTRIREPQRGVSLHETGVEGPQPSEKDMLVGCHQGAGYSLKRGVMLLNMDEMEPPPTLNGDKIEEHLMGVVLAYHFFLGKGLELFGEVAENTAEAEIKQYVDMDCYEPMDAK